MAISISAIKTAYDALGTLATATATAQTTLASARTGMPTYPVDVVADADYNSVTTSLATWNTALATATTAYNVAYAAQIAQELVCTNLMAPMQWFKMQTLANWGAVVTQYIGIATSLPTNITTPNTVNSAKIFTIWVSTTLPTQNFPNI